MPESKADLLASVNEGAGLVQRVFFTYLLVSLYLAILIGSTTHEQMLRESGVQLPLFGVPLSVFWVYAVAPWLFLALHVNLLVQHHLLSHKLHAFDRVLEPLSAEEEDEWRVRLYPSMFAQMLAGAERGAFKRLVLRSIVFLTVAVAPVVLLLWMQIRFLPYHSELVTWGNRFALLIDVWLIWTYWPLMMSDKEGSWWRIVIHEHPFRAGVCAAFSVVVFLVSVTVAVVPGGRLERITFTETAHDWWRASSVRPEDCESADQTDVAENKPQGTETNAAGNKPQGAETNLAGNKQKRRREGRSTDHVETPEDVEATTLIHSIWIDAAKNLSLASIRRNLIKRHLDVRDEKLLDDEPPPELLAALVWDEDEKEKLRERTVGLDLEDRDLRGAVLRGANLTKANLTNADLHGAHLGCTKLEGADMEGAVLHDAMLAGVELQQARLNRVKMTGGALDWRKGLRLTAISLDRARLVGAVLSELPMAGASLRGAFLQGANLESVKLQGADLKRAQLQGANLRNADLRDADLIGAKLQGADLRGANVAGAKFDGAELDYADLRGVKYGPFEENEVDEETRKQLKELEEDGDNIAKATLERLASMDVESLIAKNVLCNDEMKGRDGLVCVDEIVEYNRGLVKDVLKDLICDVGTFKDPPLSAAEAKALLVTWSKFIVNDRHNRDSNGGTVKDALKVYATKGKESSSILDLSLATIKEDGCYVLDILNPEEIDDLLNPKSSKSSA